MKMEELTLEQKELLTEAGKLYRNDWYQKNRQKHREYTAKYKLRKLIADGKHPDIVAKAEEIGLLEVLKNE